MKTTEVQALPAPPSLVAALLAGFDAIANHIELILFPAILDLFLWLGPQMRITNLIKGVVDQVMALQSADSSQSADIMQYTRDFWNIIAERLNLFSVIRSYPVGIPSLMAGSAPGATPIGAPQVIEIHSFLGVIGVWLAFTIAGLTLGAIYYAIVAQAALHGEISWSQAVTRWPWAALQVYLLFIFWSFLVLALSIPASCFLSVISLGGLPLGELAIYILAGFLLWMLFPLLFSPHGIFVNDRSMWISVRDGFKLTRMTMPRTALLFVSIFVINEGLGVLWRIPQDSSWLVLVGVAGHAFIASSLLAASFVYYRDAYRWIQRLIQQAKLSTIS